MAAATPILIFHNGRQYPGFWNLAPATPPPAHPFCRTPAGGLGLRAL